MEQVDGGDYGAQPPLFNAQDPGFGSIDKTNMFSKLEFYKMDSSPDKRGFWPLKIFSDHK